MTRILRLKSYKTFMHDGRSSVTYGTERGYVQLALLVGSEPAKIESPDDMVDVDDVILRMAAHIKKARIQTRRKS